MEYIDKTQGAEQAHALIDAFLSRCAEEGFRPDDDLYSKMDSDRDPNVPNAETTKTLLRRQLLEENAYRCCYCMRSIEEQNTSLEHIIPNRTQDQQSYDLYKPSFPSAIWNRMVFAKAFLLNPRWPYRAYPHTVAYENLIPSCDGKFARNAHLPLHGQDDRVSKCCNNRRGDDFVIPFVLDPVMVSQFRYMKNGLVVWPVDENLQGKDRKQLLLKHKETIDKLQLNCPELVAIRRIWFFLSSNERDCNVEEKDRTILYLTEDPNLPSHEADMLKNFWNDNYWSLLEEYRYFKNRERYYTDGGGEN